MIGHALWTRRYNADPAIVGRTIQVNSAPYTVVGVLPAGFKGLIGNAEAWVPFAVYEPAFMTQRYAHGYYLVARRKASVSEAQAIAAVGVAGAQIAAEVRRSTSMASRGAQRRHRSIHLASMVICVVRRWCCSAPSAWCC